MSHVLETPRTKKQPNAFTGKVLPLLLVLAGLAIMLYPVVASQWNNYLQERTAQRYEEILQEQDPVDVAEAFRMAEDYNRAHRDGPILDPWLARISEDNVEYQRYLEQLSDHEAMSQVVVPSIDVKLPVYHGTSEEVLQKGLGHLYGTSLPTGGVDNHSVITGHTGLTNATLFDNLDKVEVGDAVYVSTYGQRMKYEVHDIEVVLPNEVDNLKTVPGEDLLTLITCTPYGINTHRILVHAHRVPLEEDENHVFEDSYNSMQWWMWLVIAAAIIALLLVLRWMFGSKKKKSESDEKKQPEGVTEDA